MYVILWKFHVPSEKASAFIAAYNAEGAWAQLFRQAKGYLGTELLHSEESPAEYLTIDRWSSMEDYARSQTQLLEAYKARDAACESLTVRETRIGSFSVSNGEAG